MTDQSTLIVNMEPLGVRIKAELEALDWTYREAAEKSHEVAAKHGYVRRWGSKGNYVGVSYAVWQTIASATPATGTPDLEVLFLVVLTLREHGRPITLGEVLTLMGLPLDEDTSRQTGARRMVEALPEERLAELTAIAGISERKFKIVLALVAALDTLDNEEN